jgi:FkbM family methyltransferase
MKTFLKFLYLLLRTGQPTKAWFFAGWQGAGNLHLLRQVALLPGKHIQYLPTGARFSPSVWPLFGQSLSLLQQSADQYAATEKDQQLWLHTTVHGQPIAARMANHESLLCMHEVFGLHAYQVLGTGPCVAIDVGMNIGLASLYLAALPAVQAVYGYELVGATTAIARQNIAANAYAAAKVQVQHAGIAAHNGSLQLPLTGAGDVGAHLQMTAASGPTETVPLLSLADIVAQISQQHPGLPVLLKLDCEGAEYDLVPLLQKNQLHQHIAALMIEWHVKGSQPLTDVLTACGYTCFTPGIVAAQPTGFVYAVKKNHS